MELNYNSAGVAERVIGLPAPTRAVRVRGERPARVKLEASRSLLRAHYEVARTESRETVVWLAVALSALAVITMSFWF